MVMVCGQASHHKLQTTRGVVKHNIGAGNIKESIENNPRATRRFIFRHSKISRPVTVFNSGFRFMMLDNCVDILFEVRIFRWEPAQ